MVPAAPALPFCPTPLVRLLWGSRSIRRTRRSATASDAARLIAVVVLPTPPFWLATATILAIRSLYTAIYSHNHILGLMPIKSGALAQVRPAREDTVGSVLTSTALFHVEQWFQNAQASCPTR